MVKPSHLILLHFIGPVFTTTSTVTPLINRYIVFRFYILPDRSFKGFLVRTEYVEDTDETFGPPVVVGLRCKSERSVRKSINETVVKTVVRRPDLWTGKVYYQV